MEKNRCVESGCPGYCCKDTDIEVSKFERRRLFPGAVKVDSLKELRSGCLEKRRVYYTRLRRKDLGNTGFQEVGWVGACPNQDENGGCKRYQEREHAARRFKFASQDCNKVRREYGLPPIFVEVVK
jgi:hypothetical protein